MTNQLHLMLSSPDVGALSHQMQSIGRCYVRYFNAEYKRSGTLWEGGGIIEETGNVKKLEINNSDSLFFLVFYMLLMVKTFLNKLHPSR